MKNKKKSTNFVNKKRRKVIKTLGTAALIAGASNFLPMPWVRKADASNHLLIGVPSSLSTPYGVADDQDHLNGTIMAIEHLNLPIFGVQFHPESIATDFGHQLLKNFLSLKK